MTLKKYILAVIILITTSANAQLPESFYSYSEEIKSLPYEMTELTSTWSLRYKPDGWSAFSWSLNPMKSIRETDFAYDVNRKALILDFSKVDYQNSNPGIFIHAMISPPIIIPESGVLRMSFDVAVEEIKNTMFCDVCFAIRPFDESNAQTSANKRFNMLEYGELFNNRYWRELIPNTCGEYVTLNIELFKEYPSKSIMQSNNLADFRYKAGEKVCLVIYSRFGRGSSNIQNRQGELRLRNIKLYAGIGTEEKI